MAPQPSSQGGDQRGSPSQAWNWGPTADPGDFLCARFSHKRHGQREAHPGTGRCKCPHNVWQNNPQAETAQTLEKHCEANDSFNQLLDEQHPDQQASAAQSTGVRRRSWSAKSPEGDISSLDSKWIWNQRWRLHWHHLLHASWPRPRSCLSWIEQKSSSARHPQCWGGQVKSRFSAPHSYQAV